MTYEGDNPGYGYTYGTLTAVRGHRYIEDSRIEVNDMDLMGSGTVEWDGDLPIGHSMIDFAGVAGYKIAKKCGAI